jgi:predicted membrane chloride channel (bestrophin family)
VAAYAGREDLLDELDADMSLPMEIIFRVGLYISQSREAKTIDPGTAGTVMGGLSILTECLGAFERILYTPIPKAYTIHLKQSIFLYILTLPFTFVKELQWFVIPIVGLVSFTLLGIEGIGSEIENPFGYDDNDLPLNQYCEELKKEVEYIIFHVPYKSRSILLEGR